MKSFKNYTLLPYFKVHIRTDEKFCSIGRIKAFDPQRSLNRFAHQFFSLFQTHLKTATFLFSSSLPPKKKLSCVWATSHPTVAVWQKAACSLYTAGFSTYTCWSASDKSWKARSLQVIALAHSIHLFTLLVLQTSSKEDYMLLVKKRK